jgi:hypothetical protein
MPPRSVARQKRAQILLQSIWDTFGYPGREDFVSEARRQAENLAKALAKARGE